MKLRFEFINKTFKWPLNESTGVQFGFKALHGETEESVYRDSSFIHTNTQHHTQKLSQRASGINYLYNANSPLKQYSSSIFVMLAWSLGI